MRQVSFTCIAGLLAWALAGDQATAARTRHWRQTSMEQFGRGIQQGVAVTFTDEAKLRLLHPMREVVEEYLDDELPRHAASRPEGGYVRAWEDDGRIYASRHAPDRTPIGEAFPVSPAAGPGSAYPALPRVATGPGGGFAIVWATSRPGGIFGRFYDPSGGPRGNAVAIHDGLGSSAWRDYPTAVADAHGNYRVIWSEGFTSPRDMMLLCAQRFTREGRRIGANFRLLDREPDEFQEWTASAAAPDGSFAVAWIEGDYRALIQFFDQDGAPSGDALIVDTTDRNRYNTFQRLWSVDLAFGAQGDLLAAWGLELYRDATGWGLFYGICGQLFRNRASLAEWFTVHEWPPGRRPDEPKDRYYPHPDVFLGPDGAFTTSWVVKMRVYASAWRWEPVNTGVFTSEVRDTSPLGAEFQAISWEADTEPGVTEVKLQLRTAPDPEALNQAEWSGPEEAEYYTMPGQAIHPRHHGDRLVQYRVLLTTRDPARTPSLGYVDITYEHLDANPPAVPTGLTATGSVAGVRLTWDANAEADLSRYRVHREPAPPSSWTGSRWTRTPAYNDPAVQAGTTYSYAVSAEDTEDNESEPSEFVSIHYSALHAARPATPADFAAEAGHSRVRLSWEPNTEGDLMEYRLYREEAPGRYNPVAYDPIWTRYLPPSETVYVDPSARTGATYYYAMRAVDIYLDESWLTDEHSGSPYGVVLRVEAEAGRDDGNGSPTDPFATIGRGLAAAIFGDTVSVGPGAYPENVELREGVVLAGAGAGVSEIRGQQMGAAVVQGAPGATISGFALRQTPGSQWATLWSIGTGLAVADNIILNGGPSILASGVGIVVFANSTISRNLITQAAEGIYASGFSELTIDNNLIYDVGSGMTLAGSGAEVRNNTVFVSRQASRVTGPALRVAGRGLVYVHGNILVSENPEEGSGALRTGLQNHAVSRLYNNILGGPPDSSPSAGSLTVDPLFVDAGQRDFRLHIESPCRDAGPPASGLHDRDGTRNDMGAYGGPDPIRITPGQWIPTATPSLGRAGIPSEARLSPCYPNPFNGSTIIGFTVPGTTPGHGSHVEIAVYDLLGQRVRSLVRGELEAGEHRASWDGRDDAGRVLGSGIFLCRLRAGSQARARKVLLVR